MCYDFSEIKYNDCSDHCLKYFLRGGFKMGFGFSLFESVFPVIFLLMFCLIFGMFIVAFVKSIGQWNKNNHSPRLTVEATVVGKRTDIRRHSGSHHNGHHHSSSTSTTYYVTFQVESGDRMELMVSGYESGMLVEGDKGRLTFQGTRYLSFEREF